MNQKRVNKSDWLGASAEERQRYIAREMHIDHPELVTCLVEIKRKMLRCKNEGKGSAVAVLCPSGCGKTHALHYLKQAWPDVHTSHLTSVPVVAFEIPTSATKKAMGAALLRAMGDNYTVGTAISLLERITYLLPQIGTQLILIDNVHDVPEKRGSQGILEIGGWIRRLIDSSQVLVVLLGTFALPKLYAKNGQFRRRSIAELHINPFYFDDVLSKRRFINFLAQVDKRLPLAEESEIASDEMAERIFCATYGIPSFIFQLLIEATSISVGAKKEKIEKIDLAKAFAMLYNDAAKNMNPFVGPNLPRPLDQVGEPFFNWYDDSNPPPTRRAISYNAGAQVKTS